MRVGVVGGGILGLAVARLATQRWPGAEVMVFEKEERLAAHQTGHNSGVVHAGIYYAEGSLKARLCRRGASLLAAYCRERDLPYVECGKLVIAAREDELGRLAALEERASANGVPGLRRLDPAELRAVEPAASGVAALHSPTTAITDFGRVARSLAADVEAAGGRVRTGIEVERVTARGGGAEILVAGEPFRCDRAIVCAGLQADRLARQAGLDPDPRIVPFRGEYYRLRPQRADLVRGLIYPVPDPALPFLGVHLTRRVDGEVLIGPNAIPALALEGYRRRDANWRDLREAVTWPGTRRLAWQHRRAAATELARAASKRLYIREARRYVPTLRAADALPAAAGVRAQAVARDGTLVDDFRLSRDGAVSWVRNAPSPAATSSLAIAEEILA